jgi:hypothetical protein
MEAFLSAGVVKLLLDAPAKRWVPRRFDVGWSIRKAPQSDRSLRAPDLVRGEEPTAATTLPAADDKDADAFGIPPQSEPNQPTGKQSAERSDKRMGNSLPSARTIHTALDAAGKGKVPLVIWPEPTALGPVPSATKELESARMSNSEQAVRSP